MTNNIDLDSFDDNYAKYDSDTDSDLDSMEENSKSSNFTKRFIRETDFNSDKQLKHFFKNRKNPNPLQFNDTPKSKKNDKEKTHKKEKLKKHKKQKKLKTPRTFWGLITKTFNRYGGAIIVIGSVLLIMAYMLHVKKSGNTIEKPKIVLKK